MSADVFECKSALLTNSGCTDTGTVQQQECERQDVFVCLRIVLPLNCFECVCVRLPENKQICEKEDPATAVENAPRPASLP